MNACLKKIILISCLAGCGVVALVLFFCDPVRVPIYPVCVFHRVTGLDCPGCGSLRAMHELLHGHLLTALHFNALFVCSLPIFAWLGFRFAWHEIKNGPAVRVRPFWIWFYVAVWIAFGILRDLPVPLFASFAP
jgi:hypothetical protein